MVMSCDGAQNYVFYLFLGDLERRAKLREPATLLIMNATRSDTADYRCEVSAPNDQKSFDEILISLVVRGKQTLYLLIRYFYFYFYFLHFFFGKALLVYTSCNAVTWGAASQRTRSWRTFEDACAPASAVRVCSGYMRKPLKLHMSLIRDLKGEQYVHLAVHLGAKDAPIKSLLCMYLKTVCFVWHTVKPVVPRCSVPKSVPVGKSAELHCVEDDGFPKSRYQWFRNKEEIPEDPKSSPKFFNSSYTLNGEMGTLVSRGGWCGCRKRGVEAWRKGIF